MSKVPQKDSLSIIIYDHHFDKVHYALVVASAAAAIGTPTTLFFTMGACEILLANRENTMPSWHQMPLSDNTITSAKERNEFYKDIGVATLEELLDACKSFGVKFMVCEMGLRAKGIECHPLRKDITITLGGIVSFLNSVSKKGSIVFI